MNIHAIVLAFAMPTMIMQDDSCHFGPSNAVVPPPMVGPNAKTFECRIRSSKPVDMCGTVKTTQLEYFAEALADTAIDACAILNAAAQARGESLPICDECIDMTSMAPHAPGTPMPGCDPTCAPGDASCCTVDCDPTCGC